MGFVSPNDMIQAAKTEMLDGREPESNDDWAKIVNFCAFNIDPQAASSAMKLFRMLFSIPLTEEAVETIVQFQIASRARNEA